MRESHSRLEYAEIRNTFRYTLKQLAPEDLDEALAQWARKNSRSFKLLGTYPTLALPTEVVHHVNGNKQDNRPENI